MNSQGTQPYVDMYPLSPKLPSHPGCHITLSRVPCAVQYILVRYQFSVCQCVHALSHFLPFRIGVMPVLLLFLIVEWVEISWPCYLQYLLPESIFLLAFFWGHWATVLFLYILVACAELLHPSLIFSFSLIHFVFIKAKLPGLAMFM